MILMSFVSTVRHVSLLTSAPSRRVNSLLQVSCGSSQLLFFKTEMKETASFQSRTLEAIEL